MEISNYIMTILRMQMMVVLSWAAHNFKRIDNGVKFEVNGFLFKGVVKIEYVEGWDSFSVSLVKNGETEKVVENVYFDELVNVIDGLVERCPNYDERVKTEYGL